jgi:HAE1 family hydrophobic/amphiphilic exporter-1
MSLPEISIRRPVFAWMLMLGLIIFGWISFRDLGISQLPDVDFPVVGVSLSLNGASPEVMESQVVDPVEDAIMGIQGIRNISSNSQQGSANISVEFEVNRNIDVALQEIEARIAQVQKALPVDLNPVTVRKTNPEDQPIMRLVLSSKGSTMSRGEMMSYARNVLFDQFSTVSGVGDIGMSGYVDPNLRVWLSVAKLKEYQLTADDVLQTIQNEHNEIPAGRLENDKTEMNVRLLGEARSPDEFSRMLVNNRGGGANYRPLTLGQVARVEEGLADVRRIARYMGEPAVGLEIFKQHGSNAIEVAQSVRKRLEEVRSGMPTGLDLDVRQDTTKFISDSVRELEFTLVLSALLTSFVCFLFLGSFSSTLNVLMAIPTSIIGSFIALRFFKFTLNTFTLLGLSLAIGVVVDDAIMMLENIVRHREKGEKRKMAAILGSREITFAAVAATIAIVAIFLPVVFMKGVIGRYFFQYGLTVTVAVLLSLLEALTLTPMRCSRYLTVAHASWWLPKAVDAFMSRLAASYERLLQVVLQHPKKILSGALVFFGLSLLILRSVPSELIPPQDQSQILLRLKGPVHASLAYTDEKTRAIEKYLSGLPEVTAYTSVVGGFGGDAVNQGMLFVSLTDRNKRKLSQAQVIEKVRKDLREQVKGIRVFVQDLSLRGFSSSRGYPVEFTVQGPAWETLTASTENLMEALKERAPLADVNTDFQAGMPEVKIIPDRMKMATHGVSLNAVSTAVNALVGGAVLNSANRYTKGDHRWDIRVRLVSEDRTRSEQLKDLHVRNNRGELISLSKLVELKETPAFQTISRRNRERAIAVYANLAPGHSQKQALESVAKIAKEVLPNGYHISLSGNAQAMRESFMSLFVALILGVFVSYMVLASQFNSFVYPLSVLLALPFSVSGAFIALKLGHQSINIFSIIGLILLMGIVKKNSILLVDFTNSVRNGGETNVKTALLKACPVRLRPILMTSIATIAGAVPAALALGPGAETRVPMAIAMIGGVAASTLLTLFVVPCAYLGLARFESK